MRIQFIEKKIDLEIESLNIIKISEYFKRYHYILLIFTILIISCISWIYFSRIGLNLSYNDAMSHLDISRRVMDNISPGLTQLGSVWLPLPHLLMLPTIWIDYFWRTGLSAGIVSMGSFILTGILAYKTVKLMNGSFYLGLVAALIITINPNFLYLQTTALTEPLFIFLFSGSLYFLLKWAKTENSSNLIYAGFFIFLSTLTRYDGWFLLIISCAAIFVSSFLSKGWHIAKGRLILFATLAFFGIFLWLLYNQLIFGNALYFANSEFSAGSQQTQMAEAGALPTKGNLILSIKTYYYAVVSNVGFFTTIFAALGWIYFMFSRRNKYFRAVGLVFISPIIFNILSLFIGQSVIFLPETVGNSWFNVRYGLIVLPIVAVFAAYFLKVGSFVFKSFIILIIVLQSLSFVFNGYVITIIDGVSGASQKNVKGLGQEIGRIAKNDDGLILASAASHDAILFSSKIPMNRFIHEGTESIWDEALKNPEKNAEYVIMRTNDNTDSVSRAMSQIPNFSEIYTLRYDGNFADFYQRTNDYKSGTNITSNDSLVWKYRCIDTMKNSRDLAREYLSNKEFESEVKKHVTAIKNLNANCVAIGTPYDEEFLPIIKTWANISHEAGLSVWFRGNWSSWEGWFNYPKNLTREDHLAKSIQFVSENQYLFKNGDIFTACPECEYGGPGNPLTTGDLNGFRNFMIQENESLKKIFQENNKKVNTNLTSLNTDVAKAILDNNTVGKMGNVIVLDHYADSISDYKTTIDFFSKKYPESKIVFGEFGAPIPDIHGDMNNEEQKEFIKSILDYLHTRPEVDGVNYWVGVNGTTAIFTDEINPKPASDVISESYAVYNLKGSIINENGKGIANIQVRINDENVTLKTNANGQFSITANKGSYLLKVIESKEYEAKNIKVNLPSKSNSNIIIRLNNKHDSIFEKLKNALNIS